MKKKSKIWIGVGAFVLAGSSAMPADAETALDRALSAPNTDTAIRYAPRSNVRLAQSGERGEAGERGHGERGKAGEAGEAGEHGGGKMPEDHTFALGLALIRGHLLIGDELIKQKQWNAAFPHFKHPVEELYGDIRGSLSAFKTPPFENELNALSDAVKAKNAKQYAAAKSKVIAALAAGDAGVKAAQSNWSHFVVETALDTLKVAAEEYEAAIVKGRIVKPVEYQDARGFIWHSEAMINGIGSDLQKKDAAALKKVRQSFAELKKAFPKAVPPKRPVKDAAAVRSLVSRIELAASNLL